jgi:membrane protein YqaA with SNARE-associated domain
MGNVAEYHVGKRGADEVYSEQSTITPEKVARVERLYKRWGSGLTLLVAVPMLGTLLSISAGMFGIPLYGFIFWTVVGKFGRNLLIVLLFGVILQSLS